MHVEAQAVVVARVVFAWVEHVLVDVTLQGHSQVASHFNELSLVGEDVIDRSSLQTRRLTEFHSRVFRLSASRELRTTPEAFIHHFDARRVRGVIEVSTDQECTLLLLAEVSH